MRWTHTKIRRMNHQNFLLLSYFWSRYDGKLKVFAMKPVTDNLWMMTRSISGITLMKRIWWLSCRRNWKISNIEWYRLGRWMNRIKVKEEMSRITLSIANEASQLSCQGLRVKVNFCCIFNIPSTWQTEVSMLVSFIDFLVTQIRSQCQ